LSARGCEDSCGKLPFARRPKTMILRCSESEPFCDATHSKVGFQSESWSATFRRRSPLQGHH